MLLHDYLAFHARNQPCSTFACFEATEISYRDAWERSGRFASALTALGVGPGVRFGVLMRNSPDMLMLFYAASRCGAVPVPLNCRLASREWASILEDAKATAIIADGEFIPFCEQLPRSVQRISIGDQLPGWSSLNGLIGASNFNDALHRPMPDDVLLQLYTSGTTGRPKGALLTQKSVDANLNQIMIAMPRMIRAGERALVVLPLFHIAAIITTLCALSNGACAVIHRDVNASAIAKALKDEEISITTLVPSIIQFLLAELSGASNPSFPHLKLILYGASPIAETVLRNAMTMFNCRFAQGYGMTEFSGISCMLTDVDHEIALSTRPDLLLSTGRPLPGTEIRVLDRAGCECPAGSIGEIFVRGPQVMASYWGASESSQPALVDGWLGTGDAGFIDATGYLFIRDRVKDMVISGGENVYPAEIEAILFRHRQVADVAVIGVPDEKWGETVMAVVVTKDGVARADELERHCRRYLGGFKVPRRYAFVDSLPRNSSGKVLKRELRNSFWPAGARQIG